MSTPATNILPFPPGENMAPLLGYSPEYAELPSPAPTLREVHAEVYARLAEAERIGRAVLTPAQTALAVELATVAYRMGCEAVGEALTMAQHSPPPFFHR